MDTVYAQTVRLLLTAAPDVFANDIFALKGGTAINLFVQNMPRLSVDLDVVYLPWATPRDEALQAIADELDTIARRLKKLGLRSRRIASNRLSDTNLIVDDDQNQLKVEVNIVFRGTVLPAERRALCAKTAEMFSAELELPMLMIDELYGSKLVAAMDRQTSSRPVRRVAGDLPALRWKLSNLLTFRKSRPADVRKQADELESQLS